MSKRKNRKRYNNGSRQDYTKGGRVGYAKKGLVDKESGESIPVLTPGMTTGRNVQQSQFAPVTVQTTAPVKATATTSTSLPVGTPTPAPTPAPAPAPVELDVVKPSVADAMKITSGDYSNNITEFQAKVDKQMNSPEYQALLLENQNSGGTNKEVLEKLQSLQQAWAEEQKYLTGNQPTSTPAPVLETRNARAEAIRQNREQERINVNIPGTPGYNPNIPTNVPTGPFGGPQGGGFDYGNIPGLTPSPTPAPSPSQLNIPTTSSIERGERIERTASQVEQSAQGVMPEAAVIPEAVKVGIDPETGKPIPEQKVTTMAAPTTVTAAQAAQVAPETITTGDVTTAQTPQEIQAAQMEAAMVQPDAEVEAAEGMISDEAIAQAAGVERVAPIEAAEVDIPEGALTERVIGTLSEGAKSNAAINAGSSLARITRAKKQLANAGLSNADITELGNDPEALEARLADFSEEERGLIAGLPEEALVSNQLDTLLSGIEEGEIPTWARPAVSQVEQMLAQRGMSASTVGRDSLLNAIIQSAMPMAQANAQAIQASVSQQRGIEAQEAEANAARRQQTALTNANNVFQMDMAQFSSDQQIALSNSKFLQTVGLTEASNEQQSVVQDALLMSQANLAEADFYQKTQIQNAQAFLQMDLTNLNNQQQANVLKAQQNQQRLLSNQAAQNAAAQFNAASENQTQQFMSNLQAQMNQYNASQMNAMSQFNATQANAAAARDAQRQADLNKFNAQLITQVDQFNSQQDFARNQWNAQNAAAVEASNVQWRRQANTVNTAAQNQINMQNAQNAFGLSMQSQSFLWQELRDQADFDFRASENEENRKAQIVATAIANEGKAGEKYDDYLTNLVSSLSSSYQSGLYGGIG